MGIVSLLAFLAGCTRDSGGDKTLISNFSCHCDRAAGRDSCRGRGGEGRFVHAYSPSWGSKHDSRQVVAAYYMRATKE